MLPAVLHVAEKLSGVVAMGLKHVSWRPSPMSSVSRCCGAPSRSPSNYARNSCFRIRRDLSAMAYGVCWSLPQPSIPLANVGESVCSPTGRSGPLRSMARHWASSRLLAKLLDVELANRKGMAIAMLIAEIVVGSFVGLLIMIRMFFSTECPDSYGCRSGRQGARVQHS